MTEAKLQAEIIKWLRSKHCFAMKCGGAGVPVGCPDIIFMLEGFWGAIEVKASPSSKYQPLQMETLLKFNEWSWARRVDPLNWSEVKQELEAML